MNENSVGVDESADVFWKDGRGEINSLSDWKANGVDIERKAGAYRVYPDENGDFVDEYGRS